MDCEPQAVARAWALPVASLEASPAVVLDWAVPQAVALSGNWVAEAVLPPAAVHYAALCLAPLSPGLAALFVVPVVPAGLFVAPAVPVVPAAHAAVGLPVVVFLIERQSIGSRPLHC